MVMIMIAPNSLVRQKEGLRGGRARGGRSKKGMTDRNSDARSEDSHRSNSVRGIGCEEQEKTWTVVWGSNPHEVQRGLGIGPILSRYEWKELQKERQSCERVLL